MGAAILPPAHRCFNMRNPIARALVLTFGILAIGALLLRTDTNVGAVLLDTANSAKAAVTLQKPLSPPPSSPLPESTPALQEHGNRPAKSTSPSSFSNSSTVPMTCDYDMKRLKRWQEQYNLQKQFEYTKRYIQILRESIPRKSMTNLYGQEFLPDEIKVVDVNQQYQPDPCPEPPLVVPVSKSPFPSTANLSDFMFGVSTTYKRFSDPRTSPLKEWTYWLTDGRGKSNGGKLILMLLEASDDELEDATEQLLAVGIDVDVFRSNPAQIMAVRYLTLVPTMYTHPDRVNKKWLVTCDDDTFFPSVHALVERFEQYDYTFPMYIGTFSEDVNNVQRHGSQAFGGAGVFLSMPMADLVSNFYQSCISDQKIQESNSGWGPQGDILLRKCIYDNSDYKLTLLNDIWQLDIHGDPSGFYESGIKPLSLHHYRGGGWHVAHPWHYTKIAHICGEDCTLQRFRTEDDFVISNGFSVAYYPEGINFDVNQMEGTFHAAPEDHGWNNDFILGPQRPSLHKTGKKLSWDLQEATVNDDGTVTQVYVRKHDDWRWKNTDGTAMANRDGVMELVWLPERV
ncbi:hypothetical protein QBC35DRAFT_551735 [Podospora australis]|uniref:Fringe-like glycosyltransferase domain-containing protein n=1 Tax=Podospora australis TaxID=1536484 RepID=A0AAN6WT73_9PEZI|nr:hypothetical protein QBC35DRAFT_551735 [Podospora australis]